MEHLLKEQLGCTDVKPCEGASSGGISSGGAFLVDGKKVFVKQNSKPGSGVMLKGEFASLLEISETNTVRTPKPIKMFEDHGTAYLAVEFLEMSQLNKYAGELGRNMANLHLHNKNLRTQAQKDEGFVGRRTEFVDKFGFHTATCCGIIPMKNDWNQNWVEFLAQRRIKYQLDLVEQNYSDVKARELWPKVLQNIPKCFPKEFEIVPALLHGDLWGGNAAELSNEPCIFDPSAFYGHSEYDLAISHMFGGFPPAYFKAYHELIPKQPGFDNRQKLYQLFHYLNHWNHFGGGYRSSSISLMQQIAKMN